MKEFFPVLHAAPLFSGISDEELAVMLSCLGARIDTFPKGARLLRAGDAVEEVGLVLAGSALVVQEDIWGNRNILSKTGPGQTFAEVFACAPGAVLNVSVEAESAVTVMFLHIRRVLSVCPSACSHHISARRTTPPTSPKPSSPPFRVRWMTTTIGSAAFFSSARWN